ncbi:MAG TPA: DUF748 domain-containing protein [Candidatus Didemnitutus sp.]|nr:DUF748 domain-containing protein [Candidatus Didemnitutus sp.]
MSQVLDVEASPVVREVRRWPRRTVITLAIIVVVLAAARLALPSYLRGAINRRLAAIPGYTGRVEAVDVQLLRGGYTMRGFEITPEAGDEPLFSAGRIDFSIAWRELLHRKLVSDILAEDVKFNYIVTSREEETHEVPADRRWQDVVNDLFPIDITYLGVERGTLRFADYTRKPKVDLAITDLRLEATGLRNRPDRSGDPFPARINLHAQTPGHGQMLLFTKLEPLADKPHMELNMEVRDVSLPVLNDFLRAYADVDVSKGRLEVFGQLAMANGRYEGYVKPFVDHIDFKDFPGEKKSAGTKLWEKIVSAAMDLVKNRRSDQVATRVPFSGDTNQMNVRTWTSIANALHHGFIAALHQGFEGTTHPDSPRTNVPDINSKPSAKPEDKPKS